MSRSRSRRRNDDDAIVGRPRRRSTVGRAHGSWGAGDGKVTARRPTQSPERPAPDRLLTPGDTQVAEMHWHELGFNPGPVDGIFTAQTAAAVRAFQARYGIPVSGSLDYATRLELLPGLDQKPTP
jgi:hypothetical protein